MFNESLKEMENERLDQETDRRAAVCCKFNEKFVQVMNINRLGGKSYIFMQDIIELNQANSRYKKECGSSESVE